MISMLFTQVPDTMLLVNVVHASAWAAFALTGSLALLFFNTLLLGELKLITGRAHIASCLLLI